MEKYCINCNHENTKGEVEPCWSCNPDLITPQHWQPKEANANKMGNCLICKNYLPYSNCELMGRIPVDFTKYAHSCFSTKPEEKPKTKWVPTWVLRTYLDSSNVLFSTLEKEPLTVNYGELLSTKSVLTDETDIKKIYELLMEVE